MEIAKRYLTKAIEYVSFINASELLTLKTMDDEPVSKKIRLIESRLNKKERYQKYTMIYKRHIHAVMTLVDILEIGNKDQPLAMDKCIKWTELFIKYFFWSLTETGKSTCFPTISIKGIVLFWKRKYSAFINNFIFFLSDENCRQIAVERVYSLLARQCLGRKYSKVAALRELLEGALYSYGNLFGVHLDIDFDKSVQNKKRDDRLLIKQNQTQNNTPNNIRSFLHAGIIGQGLKFPTKEACSPDADIRNMLIKAFMACCKQEVNHFNRFIPISIYTDAHSKINHLPVGHNENY